MGTRPDRYKKTVRTRRRYLDIEVDQSGKIERMRTDTILAFSDGKSGSVRIPAEVKRECLQALRLEGREKTSVVLRLFATGLFLLLRDVLDEVSRVSIDQEYPGHEADIKGMLLRLVHQNGQELDKGQVIFRHIGKYSAAHFKAHGVYVGIQEADRVLTAADILSLLGQ